MKLSYQYLKTSNVERKLLLRIQLSEKFAQIKCTTDEVRMSAETEVYLFHRTFIVDLIFAYVWQACFIFMNSDIISGKHLTM